MLRHDPDVMLVGEIRDRETSELAIRAALTGHLVFSTLHTNDAPGGVTRLVDLGVEPFLVASSLELVVAQRLVRRICERCREPVAFPDSVRRELGVGAEAWSRVQLTQGRGCEHCRQSGYRGRTAIHEFLDVTESIRELISQHISTSRIRKLAVEGGMRSLRQNGWDRVADGTTTPEEVLRVTEGQVLADS
jgi:type II secretory ATPase GspE/PulE/Tfp pilus assembly ATPase PilB-like protein